MKNLGTEKTLDKHLKVVKSGDDSTSLEIATDGNGARISGDLEVTGKHSDIYLKDDNPQIKSDGDITLDAARDITLDAGGLDINFKVGGTTYLNWNLVNGLCIKDMANQSDLLKFSVATNGASTIATVDDGVGEIANLTLDVDGGLYFNADRGLIYFLDASATIAKFLSADGSFASDNTFQLHSNADVDDFFSIVVGDAGVTTIATIEDAATAAHLTMQPDGDLVLDPASQKTIINATDKLYLDGGTETYIHEASADKVELVVGGDEMLTLDEANQRVTIEADKLVYKKGSGGDEFSVADSAWAGTILGIRTLGHDAGRVQYTMTTSFATIQADATVRFVAPPSGVVEVYVQAGYLDGYSGKFIYFGLSDNATYNTIGATHEELVCLTDETDQQVIQNTWVISGLTAGDTYNYWFGAKVSSTVGGDSKLSYGGTGSGHYSPFIMKVTALPTAVADFAVYD